MYPERAGAAAEQMAVMARCVIVPWWGQFELGVAFSRRSSLR